MKKILIGISISALILVASPAFAMQQYFAYYHPADMTPPTVPTDVYAMAISSSSITISWNASTDNVAVTGYKVFRSGVQVGTTANLSYTDTGLTPDTSYSYTVEAFNAAGNVSAQSSPASATTLNDTTPPTVPTGVTATPIYPTVIHLQWTASTDNVGVTGYDIYRNGILIGSTSTKTKYTDTGLTPNTTYTYTITAFDAAGNMSARSTPVSATTPA